MSDLFFNEGGYFQTRKILVFFSSDYLEQEYNRLFAAMLLGAGEGKKKKAVTGILF